MDVELTTKLEAFRNRVAKTAEEIVFSVFPTKIIELQQLIDSTSDPESPFHLSHASITDASVYPPTPEPSPSLDEPQSKKRKINADGDSVTSESSIVPYANGTGSARYPDTVLANQHISDIHKVVKKECEQLVDFSDKVKLWVTLTMPKIEDGDNFGVQVQEEVLSELLRAQESAYNLRDIARQDHIARAKICSKIIKYPNIQDYPLALREHDEKQLYLARQHLFDLRNVYAVVTDIIHKNIAKIRAPKANNGVGLY